MQILLAHAKIMFSSAAQPPQSQPAFQAVADVLAAEMARLTVPELAKQLDCNRSLAAENWQRYRDFCFAEKLPAIMAYNGQAYKHLRAQSLTEDALAFGQKHLWITCFLYGLLRPLDAIVPYRMEHCVRLQATDDVAVSRFWRDKLSDFLIDSVKADDGVLVHLSTAEYEHLFDWKRVCAEVRVIQPLFYVRKGDDLKVQAVWAKSCRGAMVRYILQNQISHPEQLQAFEHEGFVFDPHLGDPSFPHFVRG